MPGVQYIAFTVFFREKEEVHALFGPNICLGNVVDRPDLEGEETLKGLRYLVVQHELAPKRSKHETDRNHWQGYMELTEPCTDEDWFGTIKSKYFPTTPWVHLGAEKRGRDACKRYCTKEESRVLHGESACGPYEFGKWVDSKPGKRTDLEAVRAAIFDERIERRELMSRFTGEFLRYHAGIDKIYDELRTEECPDRTTSWNGVYLLLGSPGTGKSSRLPTGPDVFWLREAAGFNGYRGETTLVIDDAKGWLKFEGELLPILDRHPFKVRFLYGWGWAKWTTVWISSMHELDYWYTCPVICSKLDSLRRRITKCYRTTGDYLHVSETVMDGDEEIRWPIGKSFRQLTDLVYDESTQPEGSD